MIARIVYGKIRADADAELKSAAWEQATQAHAGLAGLRGLYLLEPPAGQEGPLMVSLWDSVEEAVSGISGPKLWGGLGGFSVIVDAPPRTEYYEVKASAAP